MRAPKLPAAQPASWWGNNSAFFDIREISSVVVKKTRNFVIMMSYNELGSKFSSRVDLGIIYLCVKFGCLRFRETLFSLENKPRENPTGLGLMEHSENKIIRHFENEVGPVVLRSSIQQTYNLQKFHTTRTKSTHDQ